MNRRALLAGMAACAVMPGRARAAGVARVGYFLANALQEPPSRERQAFLDGMRERGYVPGRTVEYAYASAEGEMAFLEDVFSDLLKRRPAVVATSSAPAALVAKRLTREIPIVMLAVGDPVGIGLVRSLSRPEGNVTGVSFLSSELAPKRLELLRAAAPSARRLMVLWDSQNANARIETGVVRSAVARFGMEVVDAPVERGADIERAMTRLKPEKVDALYVTFEGTLIAHFGATIAAGARLARVPSVAGWRGIVDAGGLISYAPDVVPLFRRAASYVDRILKGARPRDLPIEQATTVELVVNARTAREIGLAMPPEMLMRADKVIE